MAAELPRPGVEVIQEFRTTSPTVVTPTLVPCVVGVAKQLVEILESDGSGGNTLNTDALVTLPAFFIAAAASGTPAKYTGLDGLALVFSANFGLDTTVTFSDSAAAGLTPATVVSQVNDALSVANVSSVIAEVVGDDSWQLRTVGVGEFQSISISATTAPAVASAFGIGVGKTYVGISSYNQYQVDIPPEVFPDPNGNLDELAIQFETVRVFLATEGGGSGLQELKRDESFLRNGEVDDAAVSTEGSVDLVGAYPAVAAQTLSVVIDGGAQIDILFAGEANASALLVSINSALTGATATLGGSDGLVITSDSTGASSSVQIVASTGATLLGMTVETQVGANIASIDDGNGDVVTPILEFANEDFTASATQAALTGSAVGTFPLTLGSTLVISDGQQEQTITFTAAASMAAAVLEINAVVGTAAGGKITATDSAGALVLTHSDYGDESVIKIVGGTALADLDPGGTPTIVAGAEARGIPFPPQPGDFLYIDGSYYSTILQVAPGGEVDRLKVTQQVVISTDVGSKFYIQAKNLVAGGSATRPYPDLEVDSNGKVQLKHSFVRDPYGVVSSVKAPIYLSYTAVRQDVSAIAASPGLLKFDDTATLAESLYPVTADNPLALGLFFALLNAPGAQVTGIGVDEISADAPFGTVEGFTRAAEYLEGFEVYALAPLTHDQTVAQVFKTHVDFMSEPENKGERIVLWNPETPTTALDTLVGSGTDGDGLTTTTFDTKIATLAALVQNAGVTPTGTIPVSAGLYLDIASDSKRYSIKSISGSQVVVRTVAGDFAAGENDDDYYAENAFTLPLISETYAIRVRGEALVTSSGQLDKSAIAETVQSLGQTFLDRRFWMTFPDACAATLSGIEQVLDGFYMNAAIAGMIAQQPPQQSFTNFPMTGFTRVIGSNDTFSERQLNVMAAGGAYVIVQDSQSAPLIARMALTTNLTSIATRTDSITKVVDFTAKFLRKGVRNFIGRFNITQAFLDSLGSVIQGLIGFLVETGVLIGGTLNNLIQDEDAPDTVLIDITLDVPYPCNYLRLTLVV
jgi:hypothetical protein